MLTIADYCRPVSLSLGTTEAQYKAAIALVTEAMRDLSRVDVREIEVTRHPKYRIWRRLKLKNAPAVTYRAIIEITKEDVKLHLVLPRSSTTYDEVEELWKKHRTPHE